MATNPYFRTYDSKVEQQLINELTVETIKAMGRDVVYIPRDYLVIDKVFGEDPESKFSEGYPIEAYLLDFERFSGNRDIIAKFGVTITDRLTVQISKTRFEQEIYSRRNEIKKPRAGDLIYLPLSKSLFEINYVEDEAPFYQSGGLTTYTLTLELFTYSGETIETGITDIDVVEDDRKTNAILVYINRLPISGSNTIIDGEIVYQVLGVTGITAIFSNANYTANVVNFIQGATQSMLYLTGISGTISYAITQTIKGSVSGAEYYLKGVTGSISDIVLQQEPIDGSNVGENEDFRKEASTIFDFTDIDPFSEGNYG